MLATANSEVMRSRVALGRDVDGPRVGKTLTDVRVPSADGNLAQILLFHNPTLPHEN